MDFAAFAALPDDRLDLLCGALLIARDEYPDLDLAAETARVASLCLPRQASLGARPVAEAVAILADHFGGELGFHGNTGDYYDPRNSFVPDVVARRTGIPISLSVVYLELARAAGLRASGVAFPGHFLVRVEGAQAPLFIDPFAGGRTKSRAELDVALAAATAPTGASTSAYAPARTRDVLGRMLTNLRHVYATRGDLRRLLLVLDRFVELFPRAAGEVRDRGLVAAKLGSRLGAIADLERYLTLAPEAGDVAEVRRALLLLERHAAPSN